MTDAQGISRTWAYKVQSGKGTPASGSGGQLLRRTGIDLSGKKDKYSSNEIASHQQSTGATHGVGSATGTISGELSATTYGDFIQWLLRKDWAATSAISSLSLTIAASGSLYTVTRATGDFLTGGIKVGDVIPVELPPLIELKIEEVPVLECSYGQLNGQYALRVEKLLQGGKSMLSQGVQDEQ